MIAEKIYISQEDHVTFEKYKQYQDNFLILLDNGVFDIKGGVATIHFDSNSNIRKIESNSIIYKK